MSLECLPTPSVSAALALIPRFISCSTVALTCCDRVGGIFPRSVDFFAALFAKPLSSRLRCEGTH